VVKRLIYSYSI